MFYSCSDPRRLQEVAGRVPHLRAVATPPGRCICGPVSPVRDVISREERRMKTCSERKEAALLSFSGHAACLLLATECVLTKG